MFIKISVSHQIMQWSHLTLSFVRFSCVFWMIIFISVHLVLFTCVVLYHYCMSLSHDLMHCLKSTWYCSWRSAENLNNESIIHINIHVWGLLSLYPLLMRIKVFMFSLKAEVWWCCHHGYIVDIELRKRFQSIFSVFSSDVCWYFQSSCRGFIERVLYDLMFLACKQREVHFYSSPDIIMSTWPSEEMWWESISSVLYIHSNSWFLFRFWWSTWPWLDLCWWYVWPSLGFILCQRVLENISACCHFINTPSRLDEDKQTPTHTI